ncbi:MAG: PepSY domain-containing protein [Lachnospiraceae bacterium]|nr:PepSY domain-containing protein [Lachnospiraceae bacterium]
MLRKKILFVTAVTIMTLSLSACGQEQSSAQKNQIKSSLTNTVQTEASASAQTTEINQASLQSVQTSNSSVNVDKEVSYIGEDKAMSIALEHAQYTQKDLLFSYVKLDFDDGVWNYDVEFYAENREFDYEIDAITGDILSFDFEMEGNFTPPASNKESTNSSTGKTNTTTAATNTSSGSTSSTNAGTSASTQTTTSAQTTTQTQTSAPAQTTTETQTAAPTQTTTQAAAPVQVTTPEPTPAPAQTTTSSGVSIDTARQTALARVPGATNDNIRIHEDYDDGHRVYEGKIIYNAMEYEFEIDAATENVIEWDAESIYD